MADRRRASLSIAATASIGIHSTVHLGCDDDQRHGRVWANVLEMDRDAERRRAGDDDWAPNFSDISLTASRSSRLGGSKMMKPI